MSFHEVRFPTDISRGAQGGPERRTDVVVLGSGYEERNSRWADSQRRYNAGYGVKTLDQLYTVLSFFEERRGRLYGFRWRDHADWTSTSPGNTPSALDQIQATVFTPSCATVGCHTGAVPAGALDLSTADASFMGMVNVASAQLAGAIQVIPGDPDNSYLIRKLENDVGIVGLIMPPPPALPLDPVVIAEIRQWITDGALR